MTAPLHITMTYITHRTSLLFACCPPGKNFDRTFTHPRCPVAPLYPKVNQLLALSKQYDPAGMFKTRLFDRMAKRGRFDLTPRCR
jgi:hypothetical protein